MAHITVLPATADRFDDVEMTLTGGGDGKSCQCQWWLLTNREYEGTTQDERMRMLQDETELPVPPGLIAQVDGQAAGWVRVGPRSILRRFARSRIYGPNAQGSWEDEDVWAISCFSVRREFRGEGVSKALLRAAVEQARAEGARRVEAYPRDTSVSRPSANELFRGALSSFLAAGFTETARPRPDRPIVSLELA